MTDHIVETTEQVALHTIGVRLVKIEDADGRDVTAWYGRKSHHLKPLTKEWLKGVEGRRCFDENGEPLYVFTNCRRKNRFVGLYVLLFLASVALVATYPLWSK